MEPQSGNMNLENQPPLLVRHAEMPPGASPQGLRAPAAAGHTRQARKTSSFQITSVTDTPLSDTSLLSNEGAEESGDDLDDSHTDDNSDGGSGRRAKDVLRVNLPQVPDVFVADAIPSPIIPAAGGEYGLAIVNSGQNVQEGEVKDANAGVPVTSGVSSGTSGTKPADISEWQGRFRVVKIETTEPFRRGRWLCLDFLDQPATGAPDPVPSAQLSIPLQPVRTDAPVKQQPIPEAPKLVPVVTAAPAMGTPGRPTSIVPPVPLGVPNLPVASISLPVPGAISTPVPMTPLPPLTTIPLNPQAPQLVTAQLVPMPQPPYAVVAAPPPIQTTAGFSSATTTAAAMQPGDILLPTTPISSFVPVAIPDAPHPDAAPSEQVVLEETLAQVTAANLDEPQPPADHDSAAGGNTVAIDNKIEQAMDLVKSHLMYAVREEVEVLKEQIKELVERISQLEFENKLLKSHASPETLALLRSSASNPPAGNPPS